MVMSTIQFIIQMLQSQCSAAAAMLHREPHRRHRQEALDRIKFVTEMLCNVHYKVYNAEVCNHKTLQA